MNVIPLNAQRYCFDEMAAVLNLHGFRVVKGEHHVDAIMVLAVHLHSLASTISENVPSCIVV